MFMRNLGILVFGAFVLVSSNSASAHDPDERLAVERVERRDCCCDCCDCCGVDREPIYVPSKEEFETARKKRFISIMLEKTFEFKYLKKCPRRFAQMFFPDQTFWMEIEAAKNNEFGEYEGVVFIVEYFDHDGLCYPEMVVIKE